MTKVVLTHGYCEYQSYTRLFSQSPVPPHHVLQLSAHLTQQKFTNKVIDITLNGSSYAIEELKKEVPKYCFIEAVETTLHTTLSMVEAIRDEELFKHMKIIVGGAGVHDREQYYLDAGTDVVIHGEVQSTLSALLFTMEIPMNPFLDHVPGIMFFNGHGEVTKTTAEDPEQLSIQPSTPDWEKVDLSEYRDYGKHYDGYSVAKVAVSRIPSFFSEDLKFYKSPDELVEEINLLVYHHQFDRIIIEGNILRYPKWFIDFTDRCQIEDKLRYECYVHPGVMNSDQVNRLKLSGCVRLWVKIKTTLFDELFSSLGDIANTAWETEMEVACTVVLSEEDMNIDSLNNVLQLLKEVSPDYLVMEFNIPHTNDNNRWSTLCLSVEKWLIKELEWHSICQRKTWFWPVSWAKGLHLLWRRMKLKYLV